MTAPPPPSIIRLETPDYIVRTVELTDATDGWHDWMTDPLTARNLNAKPQSLSADAVRTYISRFDRQAAHLLGIFSKEPAGLVGIRAIYVDWKSGEFLVNVLIGDPQARNKGARTQSRDAVYRHFFDDLDLHTARSSVLALNEPVVAGMAKRGWIETRKDRKPDASGRGFVELIHFHLPREVWRQKQIERTS